MLQEQHKRVKEKKRKKPNKDKVICLLPQGINIIRSGQKAPNCLFKMLSHNIILRGLKISRKKCNLEGQQFTVWPLDRNITKSLCGTSHIVFITHIIHSHFTKVFKNCECDFFFLKKSRLLGSCIGLAQIDTVQLTYLLYMYILSSFEFGVHLKFIFCVIFWGVITAHLPKILHPKKRLKHTVLQLYSILIYIHTKLRLEYAFFILLD